MIATGAQLQERLDLRNKLMAQAAEAAKIPPMNEADPKYAPVTAFVRIVDDLIGGVKYQSIEYDTVIPGMSGTKQKPVAIPRRIVVEPHQDGCHTEPLGRYIAELLQMVERQGKIIATLEQQTNNLKTEYEKVKGSFTPPSFPVDEVGPGVSAKVALSLQPLPESQQGNKQAVRPKGK